MGFIAKYQILKALVIGSTLLSSLALGENRLNYAVDAHLKKVTTGLQDKMNRDLDRRVKKKLGHSPNLYEEDRQILGQKRGAAQKAFIVPKLSSRNS